MVPVECLTVLPSAGRDVSADPIPSRELLAPRADSVEPAWDSLPAPHTPALPLLLLSHKNKKTLKKKKERKARGIGGELVEGCGTSPYGKLLLTPPPGSIPTMLCATAMMVCALTRVSL